MENRVKFISAKSFNKDDKFIIDGMVEYIQPRVMSGTHLIPWAVVGLSLQPQNIEGAIKTALGDFLNEVDAGTPKGEVSLTIKMESLTSSAVIVTANVDFPILQSNTIAKMVISKGLMVDGGMELFYDIDC